MKADMSDQIRELMDHGLRPVTMTEISSQAPSRIAALRRATAVSRLAAGRLRWAGGGFPVAQPDRVLRPGARSRRARRLAGVAGAMALAIIATVIGITDRAGPSRPAFDHGAVQFLAKVALAAARQPAPQVRNSQYMYVKTEALFPDVGMLRLGAPFPRHVHLKRSTGATWMPVKILCHSGVDYGTGFRCPSIGSLNYPTYRLLQTLPTDPRALLAMINRVERGHGPSSAQEAFVTIGDLLRSTIAPPSTAAALYRAAALIPGVTLVPHAMDAIGRPGVAVARVGPGSDGGVREELIFSRTTLQLIGERTVIARTGKVTSATAILGRAFVDHRGQEPPTRF